MRILLRFLFTDQFDHIIPELHEHYDQDFVEKIIVNPLKQKYNKIQGLVNQILESKDKDEHN